MEILDFVNKLLILPSQTPKIMAKGSGTTRVSSPSNPNSTPNNSGWLEKETSLKYTYDPEQVKFAKTQYSLLGDKFEGNYKDNFYISYIERDRNTGKFTMSEGDWVTQGRRTINDAIKEAIDLVKNAYQNNKSTRDMMYEIDSTDFESPYSARVFSELVGNNRVQIRVSRTYLKEYDKSSK